MTDSDLSHLLLWQSQAALYEVACFIWGIDKIRLK